MKKQLILYVVTILLLLLGFSGCMEDSNKDKENNDTSEVNLFIGKWKTTPYIIYENGTTYDDQPSKSTFYSNGTMGSESIEDDTIIWTPFVIENNQICFGDYNDSEHLCYNYEFSNNGTKAILITYFTNPYSEYEETYQLVVEMIKI